MATASSILDEVRTLFGDTDENLITDPNGLIWLNQAQRAMARATYELKRRKAFPVYSYMDSVAIPDDCLMIEGVLSIKDIPGNLLYKPHQEWANRNAWINNAVGYPRTWTQIDRRVFFWPRYSGSGLTTTVNATAASTATSITLASTGNLRQVGDVDIDGEQISYTNKTSTAINGCLRGLGGTDATAHASAASVMQCDFQLSYSRIATALTAVTDELEIREAWHQDLKNYLMYVTYLAEGDTEKAGQYFNLWSNALAEAENNEKRRQDATQLSIRDFESGFEITDDAYPGIY